MTMSIFCGDEADVSEDAGGDGYEQRSIEPTFVSKPVSLVWPRLDANADSSIRLIHRLLSVTAVAASLMLLRFLLSFAIASVRS